MIVVGTLFCCRFNLLPLCVWREKCGLCASNFSLGKQSFNVSLFPSKPWNVFHHLSFAVLIWQICMLCSLVWRGVSGCVCFRELSGPVEVPGAGAQEQGGLLRRLFGSDAQQQSQATVQSPSQADGLQPETQTSSPSTNVRTIR